MTGLANMFCKGLDRNFRVCGTYCLKSSHRQYANDMAAVTTTVKLSRCDRDQMALRAQNIYYFWPITEKVCGPLSMPGGLQVNEGRNSGEEAFLLFHCQDERIDSKMETTGHHHHLSQAAHRCDLLSPGCWLTSSTPPDRKSVV